MSALAIIGGSGLDDPRFMESPKEVVMETPYGAPSSSFHCGVIRGVDVVLLSRHGRQHTLPPSQVNNRANIWALKELGCQRVLATAACGSLRAEIGRGCLVVPDQFIDFTRQRATTFFEKFEPGIENARHTPMADPYDAEMQQCLLGTGRSLGLDMQGGKTLVTIEGPRFSTRAESRMFRSWGADVVNMTIAPETILANELGLAYAVVAVVTDFDSWKEDEPPLLVEELVKVFMDNVEHVTKLLLSAIPSLAQEAM